MTGSGALDVVIGLAFVYFTFSLICSRINESVAGWKGWRADGVERGIRGLLEGHDGPVGERLTQAAVTANALVANLSSGHSKGKQRRPSYLPAVAFAQAVIDQLSPPAAALLRKLQEADPPVPAEAQPLIEAALSTPIPDARAIEKLAEALSSLPADDPRRQLTREALAHIDPVPLSQVRAAIDHLEADHPAKAPLLRLLKEANGERDRFLGLVAHWYDDSMDRVTGWYRRKVQLWLLLYAVVITAALNVDTVAISRTLWQDKVVREAVVAAEANTIATGGVDSSKVADRIASVQKLNLPVGWSLHGSPGDPQRWPGNDPGGLIVKVVGLALTVAALSLGAPFWFDLLGKLSRVRLSGDKPPPAPPVPMATTRPPLPPPPMPPDHDPPAARRGP
ncbi:MAG: hypothetical protein QOG64_2319 [Acidimicrobiaceae bacterium]|nr:hypothetical protein [Acidimicrobiaceae bacterium]